MNAIGRILLVTVVIGAAWAALLAALWATFVAGVWMAVQGPTLTQAVTGLALVVVLVIVGRSYQLVIRTIREEPQR